MINYYRDNKNTWKENKNQCLVSTPYGKGIVIRTRPSQYTNHKSKSNHQIENGVNKDSFTRSSSKISPSLIQEIQLLDWKSAILYTSNTDLPNIKPEIGHNALCQFGRGIITNIIIDEDETQKYVIELTSWRLAGRSFVKCYLNSSSFSIVRKKHLHEMNSYDKVSYAQSKKKEASGYFSKCLFEQALFTYTAAVDTVRYVQHDATSSNELRADLLEVMVTCSNNAATCCVKLKQWVEAKRFATQAFILLDALYNKRGMKIHSILNKDGITDAKLFAEWKGKSLMIVAKAHMNLKDYEQANEWLKKAKSSVELYITVDSKNNTVGNNANKNHVVSTKDYSASKTALSSMDKEIKRLLHTSMQMKKAIDKKEKLRAQAMFGGSGTSALSTSITKTTNIENTPSNENLDLSLNNSSKSNLDSTKSTKIYTLEAISSNAALPNGDLKSGKMSPSSILKKQSANSEGSTKSNSQNNRRVKFEGIHNDDDDDDETWYEEHKEAFIMVGIFVVACATMLMRPRKK